MKIYKLCMVLLLIFGFTFNVYSADFLTLSGSKLTDEQIFEKNDKTVLLFWTTWCPYCGDQLSYIKDKINSFEKKGISLYLVNTGEKQSSVMKFAKRYNLPADRIILNRSKSLAVSAGIMGFPTYIVLYKGAILTQLNVMEDKSLDALFKLYDNVAEMVSE